MKAVIQRVSQASVSINGNIKSKIGLGYLILLGIENADNSEDIDWLTSKILNLRIFSDENMNMNSDIRQVNGEILVISQFTLYAKTKKGNRPSFIKAARPEKATPLYEKFLSVLSQKHGKQCLSGEFGADMKVSLINDGPVTIIIDTKNKE